jgi:hypothetical protein
MAVPIEFVTVVARKSAIEATFPGGLEGFARQSLANFVEDDHLVREAFMSTADAYRFVEELSTTGLRYSGDANSDIAVVTTRDTATPPWLATGVCEGRWAC